MTVSLVSDLPPEVAQWWAERLALPPGQFPAAALEREAARVFPGRDSAADAKAAAILFSRRVQGV